MTRVIFGAKPSPFLLGATLKVHIKKYEDEYPKESSILNNSLYVDDLITGTDSREEALEETENVRKILNEGSFIMRKWSTNEKFIQKKWQEEEGSIQSSQNKVLGYIWNKDEDTLQIEVSDLYKDSATKRGVLKTIGRVYDPLGLVNPFSIRARILLQETWKCGTQWDDALPEELRLTWERWKEELPMIKEIKVPRHYFDQQERKNLEKLQLHCFVDASGMAYGAVIYLKYEQKETKTRLVCSKSRVSPLKKVSLPRLELLAAVIGARLSKTVQSHLGEIKVLPYFWSDSRIALHWIRGAAEKWKPFVQNRVREIQEKSDPAAWSYCPTKENPADFLTRGLKINELKDNDSWWFGPRWLKQPEEFWPKFQTQSKEIEVKDEMKKEVRKTLQVSVTEVQREELLKVEDFSTLDRLLRVTAWIRRFFYNTRNKEKRRGPLTAEELGDSERYWIKEVQQKYFQDEIKTLEGNQILSKDSKIQNFNPFLGEEKILRLGGRLHYADLSYSERHPILLPKESYFTDLVIMHSHEKIGHAGTAGTLAQVREKFWLIKGRQKVKNTLKKCIICKRFKAKPVREEIAPLPPDRVKETFPFQVTGIDFAGPLITKKNEKAYIVLFTCAVTRAIHLELIEDMTTKSFLLAFRKFIARRGLCSTVYTDNALTFKRGAKDLRRLWKAIKDPEVLEYFGKEGISWKFIVERAAWWGGFWERLVRSVKTCLKKILGRASLFFQELEVILLEVEAIINSRPLTYLYEDSSEPAPLTPAHFLIGRRMLTLPPGDVHCVQSSRETLRRKLVHKQILTERFWRSWKKAYLLELRSANLGRGIGNSTPINNGSLVWIYEDKHPRLLWKMGVVTEMHEGRDGKVRACTLRIPGGGIIRRAVQHLYPMELTQGEGTATRSSGAEDVAESNTMNFAESNTVNFAY